MGPIARGQITLVDLSDIISQSTAPANPTEGMLWMNTGVTPPVLMVYREGKWVQQNDFKQDPEYNVIKETLKTNTSGIDVLKDEIKLKVSQTEVTNTVITEIGKIEIGGTNLWIESQLQAGYESSGNIINSSSAHQTMKILTSLNSATKLTWQVWNPNKIANTSNINRFAFFNSDKVYMSSITVEKLSGAEYQTGQVAIPSGAKYARLGMIQGASGGSKDSTIKIKIEGGTKTTDWTPAPEDTQTQITEINDKTSEITQSLDGITSRVSSVESETRVNKNKWLVRQYAKNLGSNRIPTMADLMGLSVENQWEISDKADLFPYQAIVDYKLFTFSTRAYVSENKSIALNITSDDGINFYLNGDSIGSRAASGTTSITMNLKVGWNDISILLYENSGGERLTFDKKLSDNVDLMSYSSVDDISSRVKEAEQKITDSAIVNTVKNSQTNGKDTFVQTSTLEQTTESITASFKSSGGENLIYNSTGKGGIVNWSKSNDLGVSLGTGTNSTIGSGVKEYFTLDTDTITTEKHAYSKRFELAPNTKYTLSVWIHTYTKSKGLDLFVLTSTSIEASSSSTDFTSAFTLVNSAQTNAQWKKYVSTFTTPANTKSGLVRIDNNGYNASGTGTNRVHWNALVLTKGDLERPWSAHPTETYDGITTIDNNGIRVNSSNANTYTQMSSTGFYLKKNDGTPLLTADANGLALTGKITVTSGSSVPSSSLTGTVSDSLLSQDIKDQIQQGVSAKDKVDNLDIGGRNLARKSCLQLTNSATGSFNSTTNTWTLTATPGSTSWGRGLSIKDSTTEHGIQIPFGKSVVYSFEIKTSKNINWNMDVNNKLIGGSSSTNDNDASGNRKNSARAIEANKWTKCWQYVENTDLAKNPNKLDIRDASSNFGVVTTNETEDVVFEIRNFQVEFGNIATDWTPAPEDVNATIATAQTTAQNAASAANAAQSSANTANNLHADLSNDNKLTANEKQSTKKEWDIIASEKTKIDAEASKFSVSTTAYTTAYNNLNTYLSPLLSNLGTTSDITGATYRTNFKNYYDARQDVLNAITTKSKALADAAQSTANSVTSTVNAGKDKWGQAYDRVAQWAYGAVTGSTTIDGGLIQTNTILADKIAVGDFTNYADLNSNTLSKWGWSSVSDSSATGNPWFKKNSILRDNQISKWYPCNGGESLRINADIATSVYGQASSGGAATATARGVGIMIFTLDSNGNRGYLSGQRVIAGANNAENVGTTSWTLTLGSTIRQFAVYVQVEGYPTFTGELKVRNVLVSKMASGELIVDGSITTDKIVASGISANKIKAGSLISTNNKTQINLDNGSMNIGTTSDATYLKYDTTNGLDIKGKMTFSSGTVFPDSVLNDKIQVGGSNLVVASQIGINTGTGGSANITNYADNGTVTIQKANSTDGIYLETGSLVGESTKIVLAFKIKKLSGTLSNIGGHMDTGLTGSIVSIDGLDYSFPWNSPNTVATLNDGNFHEIKVILNYAKQSSTNPKLYIQPNRTLSTAVSIEIQELRLEKGTVSTSWTLSARDYQEAITNANSTANSANQTASKVESVLNGMTQVRPDGQTVIDGDKILTGSVKADKVELYNLVIKDISDDSITTFNIDNSGSVSMKGSVQSINFDDTEGSAKGFKLTADGKAYLNEAIVDGEVRLPNAGVTNGKIAVPSGPMFSFIDDDGRFTTRDMVKPYFDQAGIKGCSAVITDYVGSDPSFLNVNDLKTLQDDGWDILCHSKTTDTVTPSIHYYVCEESRKWMDNNGFNGANIFVYPNGNLGEDAPEVERVVGEYFDYAFNITGSYNIEPYPDKMNMSRVVIDDQNTINSPFIQKIIKDTFENNGWCVFYFHSATTNSSGDYTFNVENLMSIINNIKEQGGKIVTVTEALAERNVIKDSSIRFWAGANYANRDNAPFRVLHNGEIIATKGRFEGITSGTFNLSDMLTIDRVNGYRHYGVDINDLRNEISLINTSFSTNFSVKNLAGSDAFAVNLEGVGSTTVGTETFSVGSQFKVSNESTSMLALGEKTKHLLYYEKSSNTNRLNIKSNNPNSSTDFRFEKDTGNAIVEIAGELDVTEAVQIDKVRIVKRTSDATNYGIDFIIL